MSTAAHGLFAFVFHTFGFAALFLLFVCLLFSQVAPSVRARVLSTIEGPHAQAAAIVLFSAVYCALAAIVLSFPGYVDPGEPFIISAAFFSTHHHPVYAWAIPYGPYCYLLYGWLTCLFGLSIPVLKWTVLGANLILVALLYAVFRRGLHRNGAILTTCMVLAAFALKQSYLLQIRGDVLIFISVTLALLVSQKKRSTAGVVLLAIAITLAIGIKITAILYLLFPLTRVWKRFGPLFLAASLTAAAFLSFAPFLLLRSLSFHSYFFWLTHMSGEMRSIKEFAGNVVISAILLAPCVLMFLEILRRDRERALNYLRSNVLDFSTLLLSLFALDVIAGKFGGGRHHVAPFIPLFAFVATDLYAAMRALPAGRPQSTPTRLVFAWGCLGLLLFLAEASELQDMWRLTRQQRSEAQALAADVDDILRRYPAQDVELGDGSGELNLESQYSPMYAAPQLISAGATYHFDPSSQADVELMHLETPQADIAGIEHCRRSVYLIPRSETPFHTLSIYSAMYPGLYPNHQLFSSEFQQVFDQTYKQTDRSQFFDIYTCHPIHG